MGTNLVKSKKKKLLAVKQVQFKPLVKPTLCYFEPATDNLGTGKGEFTCATAINKTERLQE